MSVATSAITYELSRSVNSDVSSKFATDAEELEPFPLDIPDRLYRRNLRKIGERQYLLDGVDPPRYGSIDEQTDESREKKIESKKNSTSKISKVIR